MRRWSTDIRLMVTLALTLLLSITGAGQADARAVELEIDAQPLNESLKSVAEAFDLQIAFFPEDAKGIEAPALAGRYTADEAFTRLLAGTPLEHRYVNEDSVAIRPKKTAGESNQPVPVSSPDADGSPRRNDPEPDQGDATSGPQSPAANEPAARAQEPAGEDAHAADDVNPRQVNERRKFTGEIVITSTRRELQVRKVPAAVSVTEGWELEAMGATTMDDYAQQVAGVNYIDDVPQRDSITMRGITTATFSNQNQAPVGLYVNEIPVTDYFEYNSNFDIIPFDVERVEFLKGPQGTLYGAASLGGAVRQILNRPNLDRNQGALHLTAASVASGSINYLAQGMFNLALAEGRFALRGVVSYQNDGGWIDHATQGKDYNSYTQENARLMASWAPSDKVRLDVTYLKQDSDLDSASNAVSSSDFDNPFITDIFTRQFFTFEQDIFNVTLSLNLGFADLTSSTSYMEKNWVSWSDYGPLPAFDSITTQEFYLGNVVGLPIGFGDLSSQLHDVTYATEPTWTKNWFQEFRLISKDTGRLDWIAGLFYADAEAYWDAWRRIWGIEDAVNALAPGWGTLLYPDDAYLFWNQQHDATEIALYGELGIDLSREWKLTLGGRYNDFERNSPMWYTVFGDRTASDPETFIMNVFAPKVSLAFRPNADLMWYGLVSRGYRTGGPNGTYIAGNPDPNPDFMYYDSDNLWNYETGIRKAWAHGRVTTDVTLFYLDWSDVQLEARFWDPVAGAFVNAIFNTRSAHSLGVEAQISAQLGRGFSVTSAITWDEAELDEDTPPIWDGRNGVIVSVPAGSKLPATPAWSTSTTLQYAWDNAKLGFPFIALDHFYKDTYVTYLQDQSGVPSYNLFGLRLGTALASGLDLTLAIRNLIDERSPTLFAPGGDGNFIPGIVPPTWNITKPRSISLTVQKNF